jgi:hypothetical protein
VNESAKDSIHGWLDQQFALFRSMIRFKVNVINIPLSCVCSSNGDTGLLVLLTEEKHLVVRHRMAAIRMMMIKSHYPRRIACGMDPACIVLVSSYFYLFYYCFKSILRHSSTNSRVAPQRMDLEYKSNSSPAGWGVIDSMMHPDS